MGMCIVRCEGLVHTILRFRIVRIALIKNICNFYSVLINISRASYISIFSVKVMIGARTKTFATYLYNDKAAKYMRCDRCPYDMCLDFSD